MHNTYEQITVTDTAQEPETNPDSKANTTKVWDIGVRLFHWTLVIAFIITYLTGEDDNPWHIYVGYYIAGLLVFRMIWGVIGTRHARFNSFVRSPSTVMRYLRSLITGSPEHYTGHNPAGGYMVIALLLMLSITTLTGLKLYGVEGHGPLAANHSSNNGITLIATAMSDDEHEYARDERDEDENENPQHEFWEEAHEIAANLTVLLILLHIAGVVISSRLHRENLVKAMITGRKKSD